MMDSQGKIIRPITSSNKRNAEPGDKKNALGLSENRENLWLTLRGSVTETIVRTPNCSAEHRLQRDTLVS